MHLHGVLMTFFSGFKPDAKIMGPEPCQNQPDARNISPIPVRFWHIMACNYLLNLRHHRLVYISSAAADGSSPSPDHHDHLSRLPWIFLGAPLWQYVKISSWCISRGGGGVLPMWWVIHMCRGFDPLFSLWQDRARSFWVLSFGVQKLPIFTKIDLFGPKLIFFPRSFWVQFSAASGTPPSVFRPSTPPGMHISSSLTYGKSHSHLHPFVRYLWNHNTCISV